MKPNLERFQAMDGLPIDVISENVVNFYQAMLDKMETQSLFKGSFLTLGLFAQ